MKLNTRKARIRKVAFAVIMSVALLLSSLSAFAAEVKEEPDLDRVGSLSLTFHYYDEDNGKIYPVTNGNSVGLFKVGEAVKDETKGWSFEPTANFKKIGSFPETTKELEEQNIDLAEKLYEMSVSVDYDVQPVEMDQTGTATFKGLEVGLYLVVQAKLGNSDDDQYTIAPFLVSIPMRNADGTLTYDVTGDSKPIGIAKGKTPPPPPPPPVPQTGQLWWPVMVFGALGVVMVCVGIIRKNKRA
jgi:hypothetical protein